MPDDVKGKALRDEIAYEYRKWNPSASIGRALEFADFILSLIAPELEKARFLDDIIKRVDDKGCYEGGWCVLYDVCDGKMWCRGIKRDFTQRRQYEKRSTGKTQREGAEMGQGEGDSGT